MAGTISSMGVAPGRNVYSKRANQEGQNVSFSGAMEDISHKARQSGPRVGTYCAIGIICAAFFKLFCG